MFHEASALVLFALGFFVMVMGFFAVFIKRLSFGWVLVIVGAAIIAIPEWLSRVS